MRCAQVKKSKKRIGSQTGVIMIIKTVSTGKAGWGDVWK